MDNKTNSAEKKDIFCKIYDDTYNDVRRYVATKINDIDNLADVLQDVYYEYYKSLLVRKTDYADNRAVIFTIAKRQIIKQYKIKNKLKLFKPSENIDMTEIDTDQNESYEDDIFDSIISNIILEDLWKYIDSLPKDTKKIFYLHFNLGLTMNEIAEEMNIRLHNVKHIIYRNIDKMKEEFISDSGKEKENAD